MLGYEEAVISKREKGLFFCGGKEGRLSGDRVDGGGIELDVRTGCKENTA